MKKRILVLHNGFPMSSDSGDKIRTHSMLQTLSKEHDLFLLAFYKQGGGNVKKEKAKLAANVKSFFFFTLPDRSPFWNLSLFIRSCIVWFIVSFYKIDIVQAETSLSVKSTKYINKRVKLVTDFHADPIPELSLNNASTAALKNARKDVLFALKHSDYIISVSNNLLNNLSKIEPYSSPSVILPCCFNENLFSSVNRLESEQLKKEYNLEDRITLCYLGGLHKWQCVEETIALFLRLRKINPKYFLFIFTNDNSSKYEEMLKEAKGDFVFKSLKHEEVPLYLSIVDVGFVLRKDSLVNINSSPTKTSEYMAAGAMVVTTQYAGDAPEIIRASGYGIVLNDVEAITDADLDNLNDNIDSFIKKKPDSSDQVRKYAFDHRLWKMNELKLLEMYKKI